MNSNINKVKKSILRSDKLIKNGVPKKLDYDIYKNTNCYAYALGITFIDEKYNPGFTYGMENKRVTRTNIIDRIIKDLNNLDIKFRIINLNDEIDLKDDEYLVKFFYAFPNIYEKTGDFHFVRQDSKTGLWYHKFGHTQPELTKNNGAELFDFYIDSTRLYYREISYFAITERKSLWQRIFKTKKCTPF